MHSKETILQAKELFQNGKGGTEIANILGINRRTVYDWIKKFKNDTPIAQLAEAVDLKSIQCRFESDSGYQQEYCYLLGQYLGDGYIDKLPRTYRLRVFTNSKDTDIINKILRSMKVVFPDNKVNSIASKTAKCTTTIVHSKLIPDLFPQHGPGPKHKRKIELEKWQMGLVEKHPYQFFMGLIDSDGSRVTRKDGKSFYQLSNKSIDIKRLFEYTCNLLDVSCTTPTDYKQVYVYHQSDVHRLDNWS